MILYRNLVTHRYDHKKNVTSAAMNIINKKFLICHSFCIYISKIIDLPPAFTLSAFFDELDS
ncbi:hypothetical protein Hanom_Chr03g00201611 [Helianthus anomalus]